MRYKLFPLLGIMLIVGGTTVDAETLKIRDIVSVGTYEQDNDFSNGEEEIEWIILEIEGNKALVVSKYCLESKPYNDDQVEITWELCDLRSWLNEVFFPAAFTEEEKEWIETTNVIAEDNAYYGTYAGNETEDKIFLLSLYDVEYYFADNEDRGCFPTEYAVEQGIYRDWGNGTCFWWLRTPGSSNRTAAVVDCKLPIMDHGFLVTNEQGGVRPAMWINLALYTGEELWQGAGGEAETEIVYTDPETIDEVRDLLNALGYDCSTPDWLGGDNMGNKIIQFKEDYGLEVNTDITYTFLAVLRNAVEDNF